MLKIRDDWERVHAGPLVCSLLEQIGGSHDKALFCQRFIGATLVIAARTYWGKNGRKVEIRQPTEWQWRIGSLHYIFIDSPDDDALFRITELPKAFAHSILIVPGNHDRVFHHALQDVMKDRAPNVFSFPGFITWRTTFAELDGHWSRIRVIRELCESYNDAVQRAGGDRSLLVELPNK